VKKLSPLPKKLSFMFGFNAQAQIGMHLANPIF
jgi:hypothetical protein